MAKIFSIKNKYSEKIFKKEKLVEFRRQNVNILKNETCIIYSSGEKKEINGMFIVERKIQAPIKSLWKMTRKIAGITEKEFKEYFQGKEIGTAIVFQSVTQFDKTFHLKEIRNYVKSFRPPQSYCNINHDMSPFINKILREQQMHLMPIAPYN